MLIILFFYIMEYWINRIYWCTESPCNPRRPYSVTKHVDRIHMYSRYKYISKSFLTKRRMSMGVTISGFKEIKIRKVRDD